MIDALVRFVGCLNLFVFFVSDFFFAYVLHQLKLDHPAIDDCAPETDEVDTIAVLSRISKGDFSAANISSVEEGDVRTANPSRERLIHRLVILASFSAPIFSFLQIINPTSMGWSMFTVPSWLGYLSVIPGLGVAMFYASRALRVSSFEDVSKTQWLSMMWFRLDMMCVMATVMLLGWGDWLVALCLFTVALYLAHRLLVTEKKLSSEIKTTQLIREEIDLTSLRATSVSADQQRGYNSVGKF